MSDNRNLVFGVIANQLGMATPEELAIASNRWIKDPQQDIGAVLIEMGVLGAEQRTLLDNVVEEQLQRHNNDVTQIIEALGGNSALFTTYAGSIYWDEHSNIKYQSIGGTRDIQAAARQNQRELWTDIRSLTLEHPGRYTLKGEQGRGAIGRVLIVHDEHVGRDIALKELLQQRGKQTSGPGMSPVSGSTHAVSRFLREARITGQLEHPGIVPVYELGRKMDGSIYYTMKLVKGDTLADKLRARTWLPNRLKLVHNYLDLCNTVAYAHARNIIHRDIKPANVMIGQFGETVILDWGLAKIKGQQDESAERLEDELRLLKNSSEASTLGGKPIGTPCYMSPEQADGLIERIDERSDVWGLGATLYEILTGKPPFTGVNAFDVIGKVLTEPLTPVLELEPNAPPELASIAERCLEKDHAHRYQSVQALVDDVVAFQTGDIVDAYSYSTQKHVQRWLKRRWAVVASLVVVAILALVFVGGTVIGMQRAKNNAAGDFNLAAAAQPQPGTPGELEPQPIPNAEALVEETEAPELEPLVPDAPPQQAQSSIDHGAAFSMFGENPQHTRRSPYVATDEFHCRWKFKTENAIYTSPALAPDGSIYIGSDDGNLYKISRTGEELWRYTTEKAIRSNPAVLSDGTVLFGGYDKYFHAVSSEGRLLWEHNLEGDIIGGCVIAEDGTIYVGCCNSMLHAFDPHGNELWKYQTGLEKAWICNTPALNAEGNIIFGCENRHVYALNPQGTVLWTRRLNAGVDSSPAIAEDGRIYVGCKNGIVYCLDNTGHIIWQFETGGQVTSSPAIDTDGTIYVGSLDNSLYAITHDGELRWKFPTGDDIYSSPLIDANGKIYFGSFDYGIYCLINEPTGFMGGRTMRDGFTTKDTVYSSPVIDSHGNLYIGSKDGYLYCFCRPPR